MLHSAPGRGLLLSVLVLLIFAASACDRSPVAPVAEACESATTPPPVRVSLEPGESLSLGAASLACLEFPGGGSQFVLAYADHSWIRAAKATLPGLAPQDFAVEIGSMRRPIAPAEAATHLDARDHHPPIVQLTLPGADFEPERAASSPLPTRRGTPWEEGEIWELLDPLSSSLRPIRVHQVQDEYLVIASIDDVEMPTLDWTLAQLDSAKASFADVGIPVLQEAFPGARPITSDGSGQILLIIHPELRERRGAVGTAYWYRLNGEARSVLMISPNDPASRRTPVSLGDLVIHELAHAYQARYHVDQHGVLPNVPVWALEGGASLLQFEFVRRLAGIGLFDNHDWRDQSGSTAETRYGRVMHPRGGELMRGYVRSAAFLKDQVHRRIAAGEPSSEAFAAISQGVLHGWRHNPASLANRQRELLEDWTPIEAILTWVLSRAADDLTESPIYQNPTFRNSWDVRFGESGWRSDGALLLGRGQVRRSENEGGSAGYFRIDASGPGGVVGLTATSDDIHWKLLRVQ